MRTTKNAIKTPLPIAPVSNLCVCLYGMFVLGLAFIDV